MEIAKEKEGDEIRNNQSQEKTITGKSCKGCLYYSSTLKSKSRNPLCVGITRSIQVHGYVVGESEMEASKEGRNLSDFKYGCLGYSMYFNSKDPSTNMQQMKAKLPACIGLELLADKNAPAAAGGVPEHVSAPIHNKEDAHGLPPPRTPKPVHSTRDNFRTRFTRNAGVVASGVAKNLIKVGNRVKNNLENILYPYRRRPK